MTPRQDKRDRPQTRREWMIEEFEQARRRRLALGATRAAMLHTVQPEREAPLDDECGTELIDVP